MYRKIAALINVDDEAASARIDDGPIPYLERTLKAHEQDGIALSDAFIADDDEPDRWQAYLNYLVNWVAGHQGEDFVGASPVPYEAWRAQSEGSDRPHRGSRTFAVAYIPEKAGLDAEDEERTIQHELSNVMRRLGVKFVVAPPDLVNDKVKAAFGGTADAGDPYKVGELGKMLDHESSAQEEHCDDLAHVASNEKCLATVDTSGLRALIAHYERNKTTLD